MGSGLPHLSLPVPGSSALRRTAASLSAFLFPLRCLFVRDTAVRAWGTEAQEHAARAVYVYVPLLRRTTTATATTGDDDSNNRVPSQIVH